MTRLVRWFAAVPVWARDTALVLLALADALLTYTGPWNAMLLLPLFAVGGLTVRRRYPVLSLALVVPALLVGCAVIAMVAALFSVAARERKNWLVATSAIVVCAVQLAVAGPFPNAAAWFAATISAALFTGGPVALGLLARAWAELRERYEELEESEGVRRTLAARQALARERAVLAREMHDVVSHNVSLIVVQAGALQVSSSDPRTRDSARAIRGLGVLTLEELRSMVGVLRGAGGSSRQVHPQPGIAELPELISTAEEDVVLDFDAGMAEQLESELPPSAQRTIYRTVQECLTNARKHAPGAPVRIRGSRSDAFVTVEISVGAPVYGPRPIPGSGYGLLGLEERAQLQGGNFRSGPSERGGWRSVLQLPAQPQRSGAIPT